MAKLRVWVKEAVHHFSFFGKVEEIADNRRHAFNEKLVGAQRRVDRRKKELEAAVENRSNVTDAKMLEITRVEDLEQLLYIALQARDAMKRKREFWRKRYAWAHQHHQQWGLIIKHRRDRLRRWIAQHEGFRPYMANGKPHEKLTPEAKHYIYLDFREGLYVTSTYEGFPGDGVHANSSYHYLQNQPDGKARCWDAGASTLGPMEEAQRRQSQECAAFLTEMFGPVNDLAYKNGIRETLAEGSELETLHDNHVHTDIRDGAPR